MYGYDASTGRWPFLIASDWRPVGLADKLEGTTIPGDKPNFLVYTRREPAGVVAAIVPWNSPLLLLCWKLAPALAAGCTMVAKPSDYSPASAVELAALMDEAGFPPGVFNVVTGFGPAVGKALAFLMDIRLDEGEIGHDEFAGRRRIPALSGRTLAGTRVIALLP